MQNPQTPDRRPNSDPNEIERAPGRNEDGDDKGVPSPDRQREPARQPGDAPDVKPDVIAGKRGGKGGDPGQGARQEGTVSPGSRSSQRQKQ